MGLGEAIARARAAGRGAAPPPFYITAPAPQERRGAEEWWQLSENPERAISGGGIREKRGRKEGRPPTGLPAAAPMGNCLGSEEAELELDKSAGRHGEPHGTTTS